MARISGVELNDNWTVDFALTRLKGIGWTSAVKVLEAISMAPKTRVKELSVDDINKISAELDKYAVEGDLIRQIRENIQRLRETGTYRGMRHARGLPVRGQRTKSNARTRRGKRKTVGSFRKDALAKMTTDSK